MESDMTNTVATVTRSQAEAENVRTLFKARNCLLWVVTSEEARVEAHLAQAAAGAGMMPRFWDVAAGVTDLAGNKVTIADPSGSEGKDPGAVLTCIEANARVGSERMMWVLRDMPAWLSGPPMAATLTSAGGARQQATSGAGPRAHGRRCFPDER